MDINANVNAVNCIVDKEYIGYTHYINLCTGKAYDVSWSSLEWLAGIFVAFIVLMAAITIFFIVSSFSD